MTGPAMVIAGAGEGGTRAAFTLREQGWDGRVVLVGAEPPPPPYERPPLSRTGEFRPLCDDQALRAAGITLISGTAATALDTAARELELADGRRLAYHHLLLATGPGPCVSTGLLSTEPLSPQPCPMEPRPAQPRPAGPGCICCAPPPTPSPRDGACCPAPGSG